jgi:cell division protein FtsB
VTRRPRIPVVPIALALAAVALVSLLLTTGRYVVHGYQVRGQERDLRLQIEQLDQDRAQLEAVRDYLKSDEYLEYVARRTLGLVKPGETLVIVSPGDDVPAAEASPVASAAGEPWWKSLFAPVPPSPTATPAPP